MSRLPFSLSTEERKHMDEHIIEQLIKDIEERQIDEVEHAGLMLMDYAELGRIAQRGQSRAKKRLSGYGAGQYGGIRIVFRRVNREYPDMDAIAATYAKHGLGPVPMKPAEPTLKVEFADENGEIS